MARLEGWKLRRELRRLARQAAELPVELVRKLYFRRWYDLVLARQIRRTHGAMPLGPEAAIYLVYPAHGLQQSHRFMLSEMARAGIAPIVVSNLALSEVDRAALLPLCAEVVERPNVGYDFGGYRDGILGLGPRLAELERLWLLNDSAWLVPQEQGWFEAARALGRDFVGATSNFALSRADVPDFRTMGWRHDVGHRNFHYASYALAIGRRALRDPGFVRFWRRLDMRNDKKRTVRRGEIGLTQWFLRHGYTHGATCEIETLDAELETLGHAEIEAIARDLVLLDNPRLAELKAEVLRSDPQTDAGRSDRIALTLFLVARQGAAYTLPGYLIERRGFQFLKKSPIRLCPDSAVITARIAAGLADPDRSGVSLEVAALMSRRRPETP